MLHCTFNSARHSTTSPELYIIIKETLLTEGAGGAVVTCHLVVCEADLITYQTGPQCQQSAS